MLIKTKSKKEGFLLIEMLVAVFIFTIVMLLSVTAVLSILDANRKNQSMKSVINNLNLVINGMAKNIAVSTSYYCGDFENNPSALDCNDGQSSDVISFVFNKDLNGNGNLDRIKYRLGTYEGEGSSGSIGNVERSIDGGDFIPITSPEVDIQSLKFYVFGTSPLIINTGDGSSLQDDTEQPRVVIVVKGYAGKKENTSTQFNLQTTVSQRSLDVLYQE
jgi:type II secretory pathway pseudopilin PulG